MYTTTEPRQAKPIVLLTHDRRVHTAYLEGGPSDYQYQEMGPMRFPESIQYTGSNETTPINDQQLVFQLAGIMNQMNQGRPNYTVNFIPWIQQSPNGLYYFSGLKDTDGLPPTAKEVKSNPNLTVPAPVDPIAGNITDIIAELTCSPESMAAVAKNIFSAYKTFINSGLGGLGGDDWSEFAYLHNQLNYSLNATDQVVNSGAFGGYGGYSLWDSVYVTSGFGCVVVVLTDDTTGIRAPILVQPLGVLLTGYIISFLLLQPPCSQIFSYSFVSDLALLTSSFDISTLTSAQGLSRLPYSFYPHVGQITTMGRSIERAQFISETNRVQLSWKDKYTDIAFRNKSYDYAVIAVPFSKVRNWRFPNTSKSSNRNKYYKLLASQ